MTVELDGDSLKPADVARVVREDESVTVPPSARERVRASRDRVEAAIESGEAVYGLNTGFGELVNERIPRDRVESLQTNLVRSHASGAGRECSREEVRAMLVTRINALVKGYSGVRERVIDHLVTMLDEGIHPVVRSRGSLGASGDLAPLAHLTLVLIGEGAADVEREGETERLPGDEALATAGLDPLTLQPKEGLALINGTQLTVGIAALLVVDAERLVRAADVAGALTTEVTMGTTASCDPAVHEVRPHAGQTTSARVVHRLCADSEIVESHRNCDRVQDAYSIRCLPQVHGAVRDAVEHLREAVTVELNSATDNPLVFDPGDVAAGDRASGGSDAAILSGGNFHGAPLAHRLDYFVAALTDLAAICERRVDRMLNPNVQESHLPPFLTGEPGVRSGYMIAQYTAAALVNECRSLGRAAIDNTPVSGNQEDHVSMCAQTALNAQTAVRNAAHVVGIELLCGTEALRYVGDALEPGTGTTAAADAVSEVSPPLDDDRPLADEMDRAAALILGGLLEARVEDALDSDLTW